MTSTVNATLVVPRFWPARGGSELHSRELAKALSRAGHEINVVCHSSTDQVSAELAVTQQKTALSMDGRCTIHRACPTGIRRHAMSLLARHHGHVRPVRPVFDALLRRFSNHAIQQHSANAQVIHAIYNGLTSVAEASLKSARARGIPFVWSPLANTDLPMGQGWSSRRFRRLYQEADALIALTQHEKEWLQDQGAPAERTFVCPMGPMLSPPSSVQAFRQKHQLGHDPVVLFLGRHDEYKGYQLLMNSSQSIWSTHPTARLLFVGPQTEFSRARFASERDPRITVLEEISQADKNAALATCDLLCVPSCRESLGVVYLEAWHYQKPVIGLDIPVLRSVINHETDGLLCSTDGKDLAGAVSNLLSDTAYRNRLGEAGKRKLEHEYSWASIVKKHHQIYAFAQRNRISA